MNIVRASLLNAVRRKWKFALVVLVFGVGLVVLTNAYDVAGAVERMDEAFGSEEPPSDVEVGEMARSGALLFLFGTLTMFFVFGTVFFGFVMPGGLVANERASAAIMLWVQHRMPLTAFYMRRYLGIQLATLAGMLAFGLVAGFAVFPGEAAGPVPEGLVMAADICVQGMLACAVSFGITALGIRRAALFGVVFFLASGLVGEILAASEVSTSTLAETARAVLPFVIFPTGPGEDLAAGLGSGVGWNWGATGMVAYHFALWTAVAWLGLRRLERRPLKL